MMTKPELVKVSDCSLQQAADRIDLSFREKIELCRLIDKLDVSSIDLCHIRQKKIDSLLVKSICSAVKNARVAVPVDVLDAESVSVAWEALKEAARPRLQVDVPVSSVQMEYLLHMKADALVSRVKDTIISCRKYTEDVEFIALDATRSDFPFLVRIISEAIEAGAISENTIGIGMVSSSFYGTEGTVNIFYDNGEWGFYGLRKLSERILDAYRNPKNAAEIRLEQRQEVFA